MNLGAAIHEKLCTHDAVSAIVDSRVYPIQSLDEVYPLIAYTFSRLPDNSIDAPEFVEYTVRISMVSRSYGDTCELGNAVIEALDRQHGIWGGVAIRSCNLSEPTTEDAESEDGDKNRMFYSQEQTYKVYARP